MAGKVFRRCPVPGRVTAGHHIVQNLQSCLLELEALSGETSVDKRREALKRVTDLFFLTSARQTADDIAVFGSVMERIAYELEVEARAELSERICDCENAPRRLVYLLATDEIPVAGPVLEHSPVLTDDDLVRIAKTKGQPHLKAMSKRASLTPPVTDVIVERGKSPVLMEIAYNQGAKFSHIGLGLLAEKARKDGQLLTALESRDDLPPELMQEIKERVAQKIKKEMADVYSESDIAEVDTLVDRTADRLDLDGIRKSNDEIQHMAAGEGLTEDIVVGLAKSDRLTDTVHALSLLSGVDARIISHTLLKADVSALGILCKSNRFSSKAYLALLHTRKGQNGVAARDIARAMREYEALSVAGATRALRFLKVRSNVHADSQADTRG